MKSLAEIQKQLVAAFKEPNKVSMPDFIKAKKTLSIESQLTIYQSIREETILETLLAIYTVSCQLVGAEFFSNMARLYIKQTPAYSPDLSDYGDNFPEFVVSFEPAQQIPYLADVAQLEWAWHAAFMCDEADVFDTENLAQLSDAEIKRIVFKLSASVSIIHSDYPIEQIWSAHQAENIEDAIEKIDWKKESVIVWQSEGYRKRQLLDQASVSFFEKVSVKTALSEWVADSEMLALLSYWIESGCIEVDRE